VDWADLTDQQTTGLLTARLRLCSAPSQPHPPLKIFNAGAGVGLLAGSPGTAGVEVDDYRGLPAGGDEP
jgi:hypothetical protein